MFLQSETHVIAIHDAVGDSRLVETIEETTALLGLDCFTGIGILFDSDKAIPADQRYADIRESLKNTMHFDLADKPGALSLGKPNIGVYILPDNHNPGTLEDLLIKSAEITYPKLLVAANHFVIASKNAGIDVKELKDFNKPAGENKAIVGAMANILKPGKSIQVSIQDNKWLKEDALQFKK